MADAKKNIRAMREIRVRGKVVKKDEVIAKSAFAHKGDWQNLCHMTPPRCEETDDSVGEAKVSSKSNKQAMPDASR